MSIILGIDPGSRITGYGVIAINGQQHEYLASGVIRITQSDLGQRMQQIFAGVQDIITQYQPTQAAIEQVFFHRNANSALKLGQARGAALVAIGYHETLNVSEYSARQIKQAVVGYGAASKEQVQQMIKTLLNLRTIPPSDAADALGIAVCHAHFLQTQKRLKIYEE